jgi:hypothetical protein
MGINRRYLATDQRLPIPFFPSPVSADFCSGQIGHSLLSASNRSPLFCHLSLTDSINAR